jgi:hypothetical protein
MLRSLACVAIGLIVSAGSLLALEGEAKIKKVDAEKSILVLTGPGGMDHTVKVAKDAKFLDAAGKDLADGLKSKELKPGVEVTVTVELEDNAPVVHALRLGKRQPGQAQPPDKVDTSKLKPLTDLGEEEYRGFKGGLFPRGKNTRPAEHEEAGLALAKQVQPLDAEGKPSADGKIVLLSVGMSNTSQAFTAFMQAAKADKDINPRLVLVNGAQGGMTAFAIQNPDDNRSGTKYWTTVDERLKAAGVTRAQVQAVWIKQADAGPTQGFPKYAQTLEAELVKIVQILPQRFPNVKLVYLSSRTYGGYAKTRLNPEPYAYESGFSVKWLIERQLQGDPALNYAPNRGQVRAPWLSWGPYLWANGSKKRSDGFSYEESDFAQDGTHESPSGQKKVAGLLLQFFKTDTTTKGWFYKPS